MQVQQLKGFGQFIAGESSENATAIEATIRT
jgi:hypothetical protein